MRQERVANRGHKAIASNHNAVVRTMLCTVQFPLKHPWEASRRMIKKADDSAAKLPAHAFQKHLHQSATSATATATFHCVMITNARGCLCTPWPGHLELWEAPSLQAQLASHRLQWPAGPSWSAMACWSAMALLERPPVKQAARVLPSEQKIPYFHLSGPPQVQGSAGPLC